MHVCSSQKYFYVAVGAKRQGVQVMRASGGGGSPSSPQPISTHTHTERAQDHNHNSCWLSRIEKQIYNDAAIINSKSVD